MRKLFALTMILALLVSLAACGGGDGAGGEQELAEEVHVYNWSDYIDPALLEEFEQEYGIRVNYDIYDSSEIVDTKLMTGGSGYDVVIHSASFSARLIPIGV